MCFVIRTCYIRIIECFMRLRRSPEMWHFPSSFPLFISKWPNLTNFSFVRRELRAFFLPRTRVRTVPEEEEQEEGRLSSCTRRNNNNVRSTCAPVMGARACQRSGRATTLNAAAAAVRSYDDVEAVRADRPLINKTAAAAPRTSRRTTARRPLFSEQTPRTRPRAPNLLRYVRCVKLCVCVCVCVCVARGPYTRRRRRRRRRRTTHKNAYVTASRSVCFSFFRFFFSFEFWFPRVRVAAIDKVARHALLAYARSAAAALGFSGSSESRNGTYLVSCGHTTASRRIKRYYLPPAVRRTDKSATVPRKPRR